MYKPVHAATASGDVAHSHAGVYTYRICSVTVCIINASVFAAVVGWAAPVHVLVARARAAPLQEPLHVATATGWPGAVHPRSRRGASWRCKS